MPLDLYKILSFIVVRFINSSLKFNLAMFEGVSLAFHSFKRVLGVIFILLAGGLFAYGLALYQSFYYLTGPVVSSVCFISSSVFLVLGLFLFFDVFANETAEGVKALAVLGLSLILFVSGVVCGAYYYVYYDLDRAEWRSVPGEGHTRDKVLFVPAVNVYPFSELSVYLLLISVILFFAGLVMKFRSSHVL